MKSVDSLYIHIPFCLSKCKYCDFFSTANENTRFLKSDLYIQALCRELEFRLAQYNLNTLKTMYIGGGTPSLLSEKQLSEILNTVNKFIHINNFSEITIEVNPDDVTKELLQSYKKLGITRISAGFQSMNNDVLKYAGRRADRENNLKALSLFKKYWRGSLSLDLISALPLETIETFESGLKEVIACNPDHISLYSLTIEDETVFGKMLDSNQLEYDWDFADEMWLKGRDVLIENGYLQYEVSNFSKPGKECNHNLTYWNHKNYIGAGCGGTGTVYPERWTNKPNIEEYVSYWSGKTDSNPPQITEGIDKNTEKIEFFMMGLRKLKGINSEDYRKFFAEEIPVTIYKKFEEWSKKGLAEILPHNNDYVFCLNKDGILFLNKFLEELFMLLE